jgi:hypothetical protein
VSITDSNAPAADPDVDEVSKFRLRQDRTFREVGGVATGEARGSCALRRVRKGEDCDTKTATREVAAR